MVIALEVSVALQLVLFEVIGAVHAVAVGGDNVAVAAPVMLGGCVDCDSCGGCGYRCAFLNEERGEGVKGGTHLLLAAVIRP